MVGIWTKFHRDDIIIIEKRFYAKHLKKMYFCYIPKARLFALITKWLDKDTLITQKAGTTFTSHGLAELTDMYLKHDIMV